MSEAPVAGSDDVRTFELPKIEGLIVGESDGRARMPTARQVDELHKQAYDDGFAAGREEGYRHGEKLAADEMAERAGILDSIISDLAQPLGRFDAELIESVAELALQIARQLVRRELHIDPGEVVGVVRETLRFLPPVARLTTVRLNPEDIELVQAALSLETDGVNLKLEPDPLISRGGCVIETDTSRIDASVESRTAAIASQLFGGERDGDGETRVRNTDNTADNNP